jgi:serine/threonine protein kinase
LGVLLSASYYAREQFRELMPPYIVPLAQAIAMFPEYTFVRALTPSAQKAAFHVRDQAGHNFCLKLIAPNYERDRLDREILALQTLTHPNVVRLIEYTFSSRPGHHRHYMVEEFVEGQDLKDVLQLGNPWAPRRVAQFFSALSDGLFALKQKEIVHRDLKPENIRVRPDETPVIIDFGLARHLALPDLTNTIQGAAIGTPLYFAPEQFDGTKHDIDHRTDLFAVGILIYEALSGVPPFFHPSMTTLAQLRHAVCETDVHLTKPAFLALDGRWRTLVKRLLEKERAKRPSDAGQLGTILRKLGGL